MPLPRLGIVEPVRVCETCYDELNAPKTVKPSSNTNVPSGLQSSRSLQPRNARIEDDDDRDLKMALQMSLEEARRTGIGPSQLPQQEPPQPITQNNRLPDEAEDQDLKAAIAASLKDMEAMKGMQYPSVQPPQSTGQQPVPESAPIENTYSTQPLVRNLKGMSLIRRWPPPSTRAMNYLPWRPRISLCLRLSSTE